jgi:hypothetical protein
VNELKYLSNIELMNQNVKEAVVTYSLCYGYRLDVSVPPNSLLKPDFQSDSLWRWGLWEVIR